MLRHVRAYRFLRATLTLVAAVLRYLTLRVRRRIPGLRPTEASWARAHRRTGRAIYGLATGLRGGFVKVGQIVGARADILPEALIEPLRGLHDQVPPRPLASLRAHVERELGRPIGEVFEELEEQPVAAASLAQVHRGRLRGGERVAVKVQYPEARRLFPGDLASLRRGVRVVRWLARLDLRALADELARQVVLELDFEREAASTERVRAAFAGDPGVRIPRVHRELSTGRLLVLEFLDGTPLTDLDALRGRGVDLRRVAGAVAQRYATMIFEHGFFHGDPHPGNLLVAPDGETIALLDFGLVKELPAGFADGLAATIVHALGGRLDDAVAAARAIGFELGGDPEAFREIVRALMGDNTRAASALASFRATSMTGIPDDFAVIGRAFILLNGLSHRLAPGERLIAQAVGARLMSRIAAARAASAGAS